MILFLKKNSRKFSRKVLNSVSVLCLRPNDLNLLLALCADFRIIKDLYKNDFSILVVVGRKPIVKKLPENTFILLRFLYIFFVVFTFSFDILYKKKMLRFKFF